MEKMDKALERIKDRETPSAEGLSSALQSGSVHRSGNQVITPGDQLAAVARTVRLDKKLLARNRIISDEMDPAIQTSYKMLRTRLLQRMRANGWQSIAVTSATQGDGKTVTAINLAISLAGDVNHDVCLVDLDLRHSSVAGYLGLSLSEGISDCLHQKSQLSDVVLRPDMARLLIIPNRRMEKHSSEMLSSPTMHDIATDLTQDPNRIIIYDMPPILAADDMLAFSPNVDSVLFVVAEGITARTDVMRAHELLENIQVIGTVLNRSDERTAAYY